MCKTRLCQCFQHFDIRVLWPVQGIHQQIRLFQSIVIPRLIAGGKYSLRERSIVVTSLSHSARPRYPYPGKSTIVNLRFGTVYPFNVVVRPGLLDTRAKLCGEFTNNAFNSEDFYDQLLLSVWGIVRRHSSDRGRRLRGHRQRAIGRIFRR